MMRTMEATDFLILATGMKDIQKQALMGLTDDLSPVQTLSRLWDSHPIGAAFERDGNLVCVAGALPVHPNVASTFMYATDDFPKVAGEVTRFVRKGLWPTLRRMGIHRVHSLGPGDDPTGRRWKKILGFHVEAELQKYGKDKQDYVLHALILDP